MCWDIATAQTGMNPRITSQSHTVWHIQNIELLIREPKLMTHRNVALKLKEHLWQIHPAIKPRTTPKYAKKIGFLRLLDVILVNNLLLYICSLENEFGFERMRFSFIFEKFK